MKMYASMILRGFCALKNSHSNNIGDSLNNNCLNDDK